MSVFVTVIHFVHFLKCLNHLGFGHGWNPPESVGIRWNPFKIRKKTVRNPYRIVMMSGAAWGRNHKREWWLKVNWVNHFVIISVQGQLGHICKYMRLQLAFSFGLECASGLVCSRILIQHAECLEAGFLWVLSHSVVSLPCSLELCCFFVGASVRLVNGRFQLYGAEAFIVLRSWE